MKTSKRRMPKFTLLYSVLVLIILAHYVFYSDGRGAEYGYLLNDDAMCSVWWAEGAYKIAKDDPVPAEKRKGESL